MAALMCAQVRRRLCCAAAALRSRSRRGRGRAS
nr:MAG TPA: hypothetical protein [Herelleviridae sp.]